MLSWEGVSKMIKTVLCYEHEFHDLMQREIYLSFGLKDKRQVYSPTFL